MDVPPHRETRSEPIVGPPADADPHGTVTPDVPPTVLLVDDHRVFAELLREVLTTSGMTVVGICGGVAEALVAVAELRPAVVVLDHTLPTGTGAGAVAALKHRSPGTRVLMLTAVEERGVVREAMDAGCDGFVTKRQSVAAVIAAIRAVLRGETPISPDVAGGLIGRHSTAIGGDLTRREAEILQLIGAGMPNQDIADQLKISVNTVRNHVQHVLTKLDGHSKLEVVAIAARHGLLRSDR